MVKICSNEGYLWNLSFMGVAGLRTLTLGLIFGLIIGFILANIIYRTNGAEQPRLSLQTQNQSKPTGAVSNSQEGSGGAADASENQLDDSENTLTVDELHQAVIKADGDKDNLQLQRDLGIALFRYAVLEQKTDLLPDAVRLLERAATKTFVKDKELHETLGDALFVLAQLEESSKMPLARAAYQKALEIEPKNEDLLVNIGLTYFFEQPPNPPAAIKQYKQALEFQPFNEKALESLTIALLALRQTAKAAESLKKLQQVNPQNNHINDLQTQVNQLELTER
jgi:tetratricopeptide (TPR) repeat protein